MKIFIKQNSTLFKLIFQYVIFKLMLFLFLKGKRLKEHKKMLQFFKVNCNIFLLLNFLNFAGWGSRIRTHECQSQNLVPYRLAIPHFIIKKWLG